MDQLARKFTARFVYPVLLALMIGFWVSAHGKPVSAVNERNLREHYYSLLASIANLSRDQQIVFLQKFAKNHPHFERAYLKLLECYIASDKLAEANGFFRKQAGYSRRRRNSSWMLAKIADHQQKPDSAAVCYLRAVRAGGLSLELIDSFLEFGRRGGDLTWTKAVLLESCSNSNEQGIVNLYVAFYSGDYEQAQSEIASLPDSISHHPAIAYIRGRCYFANGELELADSLWQRSLHISRELGDRQAEARAFTLLAILATEMVEDSKAVSYYDSAYHIANQIQDLERLQLVAGNFGNLYKRRSEYLSAMEKYREAIRICEQTQDDRRLATWYAAYGQALYYAGNFSDALEVYGVSGGLAKREKDVYRQISIMLDRANLYFYLNLLDLAENEFQRASQLSEVYGFADLQGRGKTGIAALLVEKKQYAAARAVCQGLVKKLPSDTDPLWEAYYICDIIANTYKFEGEYQRARQEYARALELAREAESPYYVAFYKWRLADLEILSGSPEKAPQAYQEVLEYAISNQDYELLVGSYLGLGEACKKLDNLPGAIASYLKAVEAIESERASLEAPQLRIGYFSQKTAAYQSLVDCYFQQFQNTARRVYLDSLFYYSEMTRARSLQDVQAGVKLNSLPVDDPKYREYRRRCSQVRTLQRKLRLNALAGGKDWETDSLQTQLKISRYSLIGLRLTLGELAQGSTQAVPYKPSLARLMQRLREKNMGMVLYQISGSRPFAIAVTGEQAKIALLPVSREEIEKAIDALITPFHRVSPATIEMTPFKAGLAHQLYQWLVKPVEDSLALPGRIFIIPELALVNLPFELLLTRAPGQAEYTPRDTAVYAGHFLQHRYAIVYSPSTRMTQKPSRGGLLGGTRLLALANPFNFNFAFADARNGLRGVEDWYFPPLPYSQDEAESIKTLYPSTKTYYLDKANKANFFANAAKYQVLHLATHGIIDTTFEDFSGLVLAMGEDSTDDGCLMGYELSGIKLDCDLITLSACETGRGKLVSGEGVLGLPRLLLGTGANSVLMTLWKVDDLFTSRLMQEFYYQFLKEKLPKADALAEARRIILNRANEGAPLFYQHPLYWGCFTLFGDPGVARAGLPTISIVLFLIGAILILSLGWIYYHRFRNAGARRNSKRV